MIPRPERLLLATANSHKLREFERLLPGIEIVPLPLSIELPEETGSTYAENAFGKARAAAAASGVICIADDSGIEAAQLAGAPGIRSARFAGEDATDEANLGLLEREVQPGSGLEYVCVLVLVDSVTGFELSCEGRCRGVMAASRSGSRGFGYDPVFIPEALSSSATMADLTEAEKDASSHRGRAARNLLAQFDRSAG